MSKNIIKLCLLFSLFLIIILLLGYNEESLASLDVTGNNDITLKKDVDLISNSKSLKDIKNNTKVLQSAMDKVSLLGGGTVYLPSGTYYFSQGGTTNRKEKFVIKCKDNVRLKGSGIKGNSSTILKPVYSNSNSSIVGGLDMFYFNNYSESNFSHKDSDRFNIVYTDMDGKSQTLTNQKIYLDNADFEDFIIDGSDAHNKYNYDTSGKGFMINLFRDCDWNNVVVMNTDATGFGVDCPINSTMNNCVAINCGKAASENDGGASGFGIGTGYSNNEYMIIKNSYSFNNKKYGFFFEHQGRFTNENNYPATTSKGFVVSNSVAGGNYADFGGLKAHNVTFEGSTGMTGKGSYTIPLINKSISISKRGPGISFDYYSVNSKAINMNIRNNFTDSSRSEVLWALNNGITNGSSVTTFSPNSNLTRIEAVTLLYRLSSMPNGVFETCPYNNGTNCHLTKQSSSYKKTISNIGFSDLSKYTYNLDAVYWAYKAGVITSDSLFNPTNNCTRSQFVTMLYRLAGSPSVSFNNSFSDVSSNAWYAKAVSWAVNNGITNGTSNTTFSPENLVTREQAIIFLYRFSRRSNATYNITYNLMGGSVKTNPSSYKTGSSFKLNNPSKSGYTFFGWTGSNSSSPSTSVRVSSSMTGDLVYTANFDKTKYTITYKLDGGKFSSSPRSYYYIDSSDYTLLTPSKNGYTFTGWTGSNGSSPSVLVKITKGKTGDLVYTANYKKVSSNSNSSGNGSSTGSGNGSSNGSGSGSGNSSSGGSSGSSGGSSSSGSGSGSGNSSSSGSSGNSGSSSSGSSSSGNTGGGSSSTPSKPSSGTEPTKPNNPSKPNNNTKTLSSISIKTKPNKLTYYEGEKINTKGMVLKLIYSDNTTKDVNCCFSIVPSKAQKEGKQKVKVTYENKTTSYDINVKKVVVNKITIKTLPYRTTYFVGEKFSSKGLSINLIKNNNYVDSLTTGFDISISENKILDKEGKITVTVKYQNYKTTFNINVVSKKQGNLILKSRPDKTNYLVGEAISYKGLSLQYIVNNKEVDVSDYKISMSEGTILNSSGVRTIKVTYEDKIVTFDIMVKEVKTIEVKDDTLKLKYDINEKLNLDNLVLIVSYTDGTYEEVTSMYTSSIKDGTILTKKNNRIIFKYGGKEVFVDIIVGNIETNKDTSKGFNYSLIFVPFIILIIIVTLVFVIKPKSYY